METYCRAVLAEDPHAWSMRNNLGVVLKQQGDLPGAIDCYRLALRDNPRFMEARNNLGNALEATGDLPGAEEQFRAALDRHANDPQILSNLAGVYFHEGKIKNAFAAQAHAIQADRSNAELYRQFGRMLAANKQFDQAAACFKNALVLNPGDIGTEIDLSRALRASGKSAEADAVANDIREAVHRSGNTELIQKVDALLQQQNGPFDSKKP
jgi:tetratricopeptide (TPR) repeat protein